MEEKEIIGAVKGFWHWMDGQLKSKYLLYKMCVYCLPSVSRDPFFFFLTTSEDFSSNMCSCKSGYSAAGLCCHENQQLLCGEPDLSILDRDLVHHDISGLRLWEFK